MQKQVSAKNGRRADEDMQQQTAQRSRKSFRKDDAGNLTQYDPSWTEAAREGHSLRPPMLTR